jgi:hypothetical protein
MKYVMKLRDARQVAMYEHPLFDWLTSSNISHRDRLAVLPVLANFSMGFRDINKWVLRYPATKNGPERAINEHTFEDETHSRLYLEDWRRLDLDRELGWAASDTLWWLFLSNSTLALREHGMYFLRMAVEDGGDPVLRFAQSEVIEACGKVFFDNFEKVATRATDDTGIEYRYLGKFHLMRESGHIETEGALESMELDEPRRARAMSLTNTVFDIFDDLFSSFLEYAENYVEKGRKPRAELSVLSRPCSAATVPKPLYHRWTETIEGTYPKLWDALESRKIATACHPFYQWLHRGEMSARERLQRFVPMWSMDVLGYADLNRYAFRYRNPAGALERVVNRWIDDLQTHNVLYLRDWRNLGLDETLGWSASDTLEFCYLDPWMDTHRRNIVKFVELGAAHPNPVLRLWLMHVLEASGDAFFENTKVVALEAERECRIRLDYLADRHDTVHPTSTGDTPEDCPDAEEFRLDEHDVDVGLAMVQTVFDSVDEQLSLSLDVALSNRLRIGR